jgi:Spy/CpxP family protein refolding chaperone
MNLTWKHAAAAGALCLGIAAAAAAGAQPAHGPGSPPAAGERGQDHRRMFENMRARRQQRLHDLLQIRADQDGAFHAFLTALTPPDRADKAHRGPRGDEGPDAKPMTTPERLDKMAARMAERQQRFQQLASATKTFYAALTPSQQKVFDEMPPMAGREEGHGGLEMGRFMHRRGERGGPGGPGFMGPPPPPPGA